MMTLKERMEREFCLPVSRMTTLYLHTQKPENIRNLYFLVIDYGKSTRPIFAWIRIKDEALMADLLTYHPAELRLIREEPTNWSLVAITKPRLEHIVVAKVMDDEVGRILGWMGREEF